MSEITSKIIKHATCLFFKTNNRSHVAAVHGFLL